MLIEGVRELSSNILDIDRDNYTVSMFDVPFFNISASFRFCFMGFL